MPQEMSEQDCLPEQSLAGVAVFVQLRKGLNAVTYRERYLRGEEPDESPYGFHLASTRLGAELTFSNDKEYSGKLYNLLERALLRWLGFDILHAWYNRHAMARADVIWTMRETEALAVLALMRLGILGQKPLIAGTVWMINRWYKLGVVRRSVYRSLASYCSVLTVHTLSCLDRCRIALPKAHSALLRFGVSQSSFAGLDRSAAQVSPILIVAAGNDQTRDWQVLLDAFGNDPRFELVIICRWIDRKQAERVRNLHIPENVTQEDFRHFYGRATYIAVPMFENIFSGITVAIEAAVGGVPLLATRTGGVPTYFNESEALYVDVNAADSMRDRVLAQSASDRQDMARLAQQRYQQDDLTTLGMIRRYAEMTAEILTPKSRDAI